MDTVITQIPRKGERKGQYFSALPQVSDFEQSVLSIFIKNMNMLLIDHHFFSLTYNVQVYFVTKFKSKTFCEQ